MTQSVPSRIAFATSVASARVGKRLDTIDSSICVAVMTGFPARFAFAMSCFCVCAISSIGTSTPRSPRATMIPSAAARISSKCSSASERSILAMMNGTRPIFAAAVRAASSMSFARSTNDWLTASTPAPSANSRHSRSRSVKALMPEIDPRQVQSFARTQLAADRDGAMHVVAFDALDDELHKAVVEEEAVAGFHHARQRFEAHRNAMRVADNVFVRESELVARAKLNRLRIDLPEAHFRSWQIRHDRHASSCLALRFANASDDFAVLREVAVRKVQPRHVEAGADEARQHLGRFRGRPDGGDDLGLVRGKSCRHATNIVLPAPRRSLTACFTRSAIATSARAR